MSDSEQQNTKIDDLDEPVTPIRKSVFSQKPPVLKLGSSDTFKVQQKYAGRIKNLWSHY